MILGEVKARPKDIISFSLDYISKSKVQTSNPSSSPTPLDTPARPADLFWSGSKPFRLAVFAVFEGYTHMQRAMPTTVGTWLDSFAQGWKDATNVLEGACLGRTLWSKVGQFWASKRCALDLPPGTQKLYAKKEEHRKIYPKFH